MGSNAFWERCSLFFALLPRAESVLLEKNQKDLFISSDSRRKGTKEDCYPQGPLHRGMQTKSRRNRRLSVGFGIAGHAMYYLMATAMKAKRDLNNLRPC